MKRHVVAAAVAVSGVLAGVLVGSAAHAAGWAESGTGSVALKPFVDPAEGAFRVGAPAGWQVHGGMVRYGPISLAPVVQAMAPDGSMLIQLGDPALKDFAAPRWGFRAGSIYRPGSAIFVVRVPETGLQFARAYGATWTGNLQCRDAQITEAREVPNLPGTDTTFGRVTSGLVSFRCSVGGRSLQGKVFAATKVVNAPGGADWSVVALGSYVSDTGHSAEAEEILKEMSKTYTVDPNWSRRESDIAAGTVRIAMRAWDANLDLTRQFDQQGIRGEVTVADPTLGTRHDVPLGGPYYFSDGLGRTISGPTSTAPLGFHPVAP